MRVDKMNTEHINTEDRSDFIKHTREKLNPASVSLSCRSNKYTKPATTQPREHKTLAITQSDEI